MFEFCGILTAVTGAIYRGFSFFCKFNIFIKYFTTENAGRKIITLQRKILGNGLILPPTAALLGFLGDLASFSSKDSASFALKKFVTSSI